MTLDDLLKLAKKPRRVEAVAVGDGFIHVRGLSAQETEDAAALAGDESAFSVRSALLASALCEQDGTPLCGDVALHAASIASLPAMLVRRLDRALDLASDVPPGAMEAFGKNSPGSAGGSGTASPDT